MIRSELIDRLALKFPRLTAREIEQVTRVILDTLSNALGKGQRVEIRGFGSFNIVERPPRNGRNPKTGEPVSVPAKLALHFKPGKALRERVDQSVRVQ
jgi:integration host factor subunit beta